MRRRVPRAAMRVGVDARALLAGRGVARYTRGLLGRARRAASATTIGSPSCPAARRSRASRRASSSSATASAARALFGAAARRAAPARSTALLGGADVVWLPAPAPRRARRAATCSPSTTAPGSDRPRDFTRYERAVAPRSPGRARWPRGAARRRPPTRTRSPPSCAPRWGVRRDGRLPRASPRLARRAPRPGPLPALRRRARAAQGARRARRALRARPRPGPRGRARGRRRRPRAVAARACDGTPGDAELASLYAGALAVVQPSWLEGFGLPPLEAAAHGTPAVVSDLPCFAETLGDGALRVAPGDADALAEALLRIAGDDDLRARLGEAARERRGAPTRGSARRRAPARAARRGGGVTAFTIVTVAARLRAPSCRGCCPRSRRTRRGAQLVVVDSGSRRRRPAHRPRRGRRRRRPRRQPRLRRREQRRRQARAPAT